MEDFHSLVLEESDLNYQDERQLLLNLLWVYRQHSAHSAHSVVFQRKSFLKCFFMFEVKYRESKIRIHEKSFPGKTMHFLNVETASENEDTFFGKPKVIGRSQQFPKIWQNLEQVEFINVGLEKKLLVEQKIICHKIQIYQKQPVLWVVGLKSPKIWQGSKKVACKKYDSL